MQPPDAYTPPRAELASPAKSAGGCGRAVVIAALIPVALFAAFAVTMIVKIRWARATTHAFCTEDVVVGAPIAGLEAKARARRLEVTSIPASPATSSGGEARPASFMIGEGFVFSRFFCDVDHDGNVVLAKRESSLD